MIPSLQQKLWLPILIAVLGVILSCLLWFVIWQDINRHLALYAVLEIYLPWLLLLLGISLSILIATIIYVGQVAHYRTLIAKQEYAVLKKEFLHAEEAKQKLEVALLQGQKLQAMGTLAGGIAHDFNNILYAIIGYVELAREDVQKDSITFKNLGKVLDATHKGQELIARILAFSRREHHQFESLLLKDTIEAALALLQPAIPASVIIHFKSQINPVILGNQTQIHQVLVNLINNAVDAMDGEGTITIGLTKQMTETQRQTYCKIEIHDTGHGMDHHTMERIFEPFYTTKEVGKGTGSRLIWRLIEISANLAYSPPMLPSALSKISSTVAWPTGLRALDPLKITSVEDSPRKYFGELSPITQVTASITLDLPQPLGPTTAISLPGKSRVSGSTNDLKPVILILQSCIILGP